MKPKQKQRRNLIDDLLSKWEFKYNNYERLQNAYEKERRRYKEPSFNWQITTEKIRAARVAKLLCMEVNKHLNRVRKHV